MKWKREHGGIYMIRGIMGEPVVTIMSAKWISHIASKAHADKYGKPKLMHNTLRSLIGHESLILTGGDTHARLRRIIAPAFHYKSLMSISNIFLHHADILADSLLGRAKIGSDKNENELKDFAPNLLELIHDRSFALIVDACFGDGVVDPRVMDRLREDYFKCIREPSSVTFRRWILQRFLNFLPAAWFGYKEQVKRVIKLRLAALLHAASSLYTSDKPSLIYRGTEGSDGGGRRGLERVPNLLSVISDAEEKHKLSQTETISLIMTFLSAGQVTTTFGIAWLLYNLARHPEWQSRLREELASQTWNLDDDDALQKLDRLPLFDRIVKESLRKDSPVTFTSRETKVAETIDGITIPPGVLIRIPIHALQRDTDVWGPDADEFNPDRWLDDKMKDASTFHTVFWHGIRGCIGQRFAILELKAFAAAVVQKSHLSVKKEDAEVYATGIFGNPVDLKIYCTSIVHTDS